ncbi:MAG: hypothetical protein WCS03_13510 [Bacteroidota bacterium]
MKKLIFSITVLLALSSCKGPGAGPLVKESFTKENQKMGGQMPTAMPNPNVMSEKINVTVEPCDGCVKIADLLANKLSYSGKIIRVKGKVTKFNPEIMGKNWVHIQDGTEFGGGFDITITTDKPASVGETVTFEGKIALDKDFGYGYFYSVLMEEGKPVL